MSPVDAQMFWMSKKIPSDQFLVFGFDGPAADVGAAVAEVRSRAEACAELRLRVVDDCGIRYPRWVDGGVVLPAQFDVRTGGLSWAACLDRVSGLVDDQLDAREMCWRMIVFPDVDDGAVVVVQMVHALGDGTRASALAALLLGRIGNVVPVEPDRGCLLPRAVAASRAHVQLKRDIEAGLLPAPTEPRPALSINALRSGRTMLRTIRLSRSQIPQVTVTVGALVAISDALGGYLRDRGEDVSLLGAEVPMRHSTKMSAHNCFRNVSVGLYPELGRIERAQRILQELRDHRVRGEHPAMLTARAAFAAAPAPLLRLGVGQFDPAVRSPVVTGNTVVSSVNRGPADLDFGGRPVRLTAGFPALSPMQSLTHGVHGIGDTIVVSVHADPESVDIDEYSTRLTASLGH
jgi:hypothetical protein